MLSKVVRDQAIDLDYHLLPKEELLQHHHPTERDPVQ